MKKILLGLAVLSALPAFAQQDINQQIVRETQKLNQLIVNQRRHVSLYQNEKVILLQTLRDAVRATTATIPNPPTPMPPSPPYPQPPTPPSPRGVSDCAWFDGQSSGIATRGWHAFRTINGVTYSLAYYDNNGIASSTACQMDLIFRHDARAYEGQVYSAKQSSCGCTWFPADVVGGPTQRGWHMFYPVTLSSGATVNVSSGYYDNNGTASQEACNRALVQNHFRCN